VTRLRAISLPHLVEQKQRDRSWAESSGGRFVELTGTFCFPCFFGKLSVFTQTSVDAQWITAKKDWQEAKRRYKASEKLKGERSKYKDGNLNSTAETGVYEQEMDEMRCILYSHGGLSTVQ